MDVENKIKDLLRTIQVTRTPWQFVTSGGGELTVGTPIARLSAGATAGAMWVRYGSEQPVRLKYGGVGGAVGLSLVPFPGISPSLYRPCPTPGSSTSFHSRERR